MNIEIWHNPRCTKSRQTLALLEEAGHELELRTHLTSSAADWESSAA